MAPHGKKVKNDKKNKKVRREKKPKGNVEIVWIYAIGKNKRKFYEFHPKFQQHIEAAFSEKKKECKLFVSGYTWVINFEKMTKTREGNSVKIRRLARDKLNPKTVIGINGVVYDKDEGYRQTDETCHVCLYRPTLPTRIETCGHEFCFMCLKSNYMMGMECPTCRARIPSAMFEWPIRNDLDIHMDCPAEYVADCAASFERGTTGKGTSQASDTIRRSSRYTRVKYYWIYQSRTDGWYRYDPKNERYLEESFMRKKQKCSLFICGYKMDVDFNEWTQVRCDEVHDHKRLVKRVLSTTIDNYAIKGIAGVRGHVRIIE